MAPMSAIADNRGSANFKYRNDYFNSLRVKSVTRLVRTFAREGEFHTTCRNGIVIKTVVPASLKISNEAASP